MHFRAMVPLIDMVFLSLGGILAVMTQMEHVTAMPVEVTEVGRGAAVIARGEPAVLCLTTEGLSLDGQSIDRAELLETGAGRAFVLRVQKTLAIEQPLALIADLVSRGAEVSLGVEELNE